MTAPFPPEMLPMLDEDAGLYDDELPPVVLEATVVTEVPDDTEALAQAAREAASALERVTKEQPTDEARLARAFALVLGRAPAGKEPALLAKMLANQRAVYAADAKAADALLAIGESPREATLPAAEHAALTATCLALYNLDAAITRD